MRRADGVILHQYRLGDILRRDREHDVADLPGAERIGGIASDRAFDRVARLQGVIERRAAGGLDADHFDPAGEPRGHPAD